MNKFFSLILLAGSSLLLNSCRSTLTNQLPPQTNPEATSKQESLETQPSSLTYEHEQQGITIKYPSDWEVRQGQQDKTINYPSDWEVNEDQLDIVVVFLSPLENEDDRYQEKVNLVVMDLTSEPMTLQEFTQISQQEINLIITDAKINSLTDIVISGEPAKKIDYQGKQEQKDYHWRQVWLIKNDHVYLLTYSAVDADYEKYLPLVQEIFDSLQINEKTD